MKKSYSEVQGYRSTLFRFFFFKKLIPTRSTGFDGGLKKLQGLAFLLFFSLFLSTTAWSQCEWTVHVWGTTYGDEVEWTLKNATGATLLSGSGYGLGFDDEKSVMADGPLTFWITNDGFFGDNMPNYEVSNGFDILQSGQLTSPQSQTFPNLLCPNFDDCTVADAGTIAGSSEVCPDINFTLIADGATQQANGLVGQWQSSIDGNDWLDVSGANYATLITTISEDTYFRYSVACEFGGSDVSNAFLVSLKSATECYCIPPVPSFTDLYWIESVSTAGASSDISNLNTGFSPNGYGNFKDNHVVISSPGQSFSVTVKNQNGASPGINVWIDWNQNGLFESDEKVYTSTAGPTSALNTYTFEVDVPTDAPFGNTVMRIRNYGSSGGDPCSLTSYGEVEDYGVQLILLDDCVGMPDAGTISGTTAVCPDEQFILINSNASDPANGISRQWQSSTDGVTWVDIDGAFYMNHTTSIIEPTHFRVMMECEFGDYAVSSEHLVDIKPAEECYCEPTFQYTGDYLSSVSTSDALSDISFTGTSGNAGGKYLDKTDMIIETFSGQQITINTSYVGGKQTIGVWADWNKDGVFGGDNNSNERLVLSYGTSPQIFTINIPENLSADDYKLRIRGTWSDQVSKGDGFACGQENYGTAIDFTIRLIQLVDCDGTPSAGVPTTDDFSICAGDPFSVSIADATAPADGLIRTWQSSPAGEDDWTDISNSAATTLNMLAGILVDTDFRYSVSCTFSDESEVSDVIQVSLNPGTECYCEAAGSSSSYGYITYVEMSGIENESTASGYSDFTDQMAHVIPGVTYDLTVKAPTGYASSVNVMVWVDWDQNGFFDADEFVHLGNCSGNTNCTNNGVTGTIAVPHTATIGVTRMRIMTTDSSTPITDACAEGIYLYGEIEDYSVNVAEGECTPPNFDYVVTANCDADDTYTVKAILNDFGTNNFISIAMTRSDGVVVFPVSVSTFLPPGYELTLIENVPAGVTVNATIQVPNPVCNSSKTWLSMGCYCMPTFNYTGDYLSSVSTDDALSDISFTGTSSANSGKYQNQTQTVLEVYAGQQITLNTAYVGGSQTIGAWADWNKNGTFGMNDPQEQLVLSYGASPQSFTINIPEDVDAGNYRFRIRGAYGDVTASGDDLACNNQNYGSVVDFTINVVELDPCDGTVSAGTLEEENIEICAGLPFTVSTLDATEPAGGLTRIWQSSPAGQNDWTDIPNAFPANYTLSNGVSEDTDFRYRVSCSHSGESDFSDVFQVTVKPANECYCTPIYSSACSLGDRISNVSLQGESVYLNNTTGCSSNGYGDYTDGPSPDVIPGETYTISVTTDYSSPTYEDVKIWIDYNHNGFFESSEVIGSTDGGGMGSGTVSYSFTVPAGIDVGEYRMRVRLVYNNANIDPCNSASWGETEDYIINVISTEECTGTPSAGVPISSNLLVCAGSEFIIGVEDASDPAEGINRYWQSSPAGADNWTDINGATSRNLTVPNGISQAMDYRYVMTCTYSDETDISDVIHVTLKPGHECYCEPTYSYTGDYLSAISTTGAETNINYTGTSSSGGQYVDNTSDILQVHPAMQIQLNTSYVGGSNTIGVWVDWNKNGVFGDNNPAEQLVLNYSSNASKSFTINIPDNIAPGDYQLRIRGVFSDYVSVGNNLACSNQSFGSTVDFTLQVFTLEGCTGSPSAGVPISTDVSVCAGSQFTIGVEDASDPAEGLNRYWQSSPAGADNWTDINGATSGNLTVPNGISQAMDYRYVMTCTHSDETDISDVIHVTLKPGIECYCTPTYNYNCDSGDDISNVSLQGESVTLNNSTGCSPNGFGDYTNGPAPDLVPGETYSINVSTSYGSPMYEDVTIWIDYDKNGFFNSSEIIGSTNGGGMGTGTVTYSFTVPGDLTPGEYRLRVRLVYSESNIDPCNQYYYGETEDYMVTILDMNECSGIPSAGTPINSTLSVCAQKEFTIGVDDASDASDGLIRIWQSSPAGEDNWTDIDGATSRNLTIQNGISQALDYRYVLTCTHSEETDISGVIHVTLKPGNECYCDPTGISTLEEITRITFADIDHSGESNALYVDYTDVVANVMATQEYQFTGEGYTGGSFTNYFTVFIDFNQDGIFDNNTERFDIGSIYYSTGYDGEQAVNTIAIPEDAVEGQTLMRVIKTYSTSATNGCTAGSSYGQVWDLTVNIGEPVWDCPDLGANIGSPCNDGDPNTVNDTVNDNCECVGQVPPAGVYCASAIDVECNAPKASYNSANSTAPNTTSCGMGSNGLWFTFEGTGMDITVTTTATFNHEMSINVGENCDGLTSIACVDNGVGTESYTIENSVLGQNYYVYVAHWSSTGTSTGTIGITLTCDEPVFDCPELEANIGDVCYVNDVAGIVTDNCECFIDDTPTFDCPELEANIGDICPLGDGEFGQLDANCQCQPIPACEIVYFLADHESDGMPSDIYRVTLNGANAEMQYIETSEEEVHIAYNPIDNMLYAITKHSNSYRTLDPVLGIWGPSVSFGQDLGQVTAAVFNHDGKLLVGSQTHKKLYGVNVNTNVVSVYDNFAPVNGGDLAYRSDGMLYLATRSGNGLFEVWPAPMNDLIVGTLPPHVTGMAITDTDQLLVSAKNQTSLILRNTDGSNPGVSYNLTLNGEPYTLRDGDMASGCNTRPPFEGYCDAFTTYYLNYDLAINESDIYKVNFTSTGLAQLVPVTNLAYEAHIAFDASQNTLYIVHVDGSAITVYNTATSTFGTDIPLSGGNFTKVTAAVFNPADGKLYIGDHNANKIYSVDVTTGAATLYGNAQVSGGDLEVINGELYLASRHGAALYKVVPGGWATLIGNIPNKVNGIARANDYDDSFIIANYGSNVFTQINASDASTVTTYQIMLNGAPFTTLDGDMAAGCADPTGDGDGEPTPIQKTVEATATLSTYPNPTEGPSKVVFKTVETTRTTVEVYDMNGRNVATLFSQEAQAGKEYTLDFNGSKLPNGVYIYRLTTQNETIIEKFMIAK